MAKESAEILKRLSELTISKEVASLFDEAFENLVEGKPNAGLADRVRASAGSPDAVSLAERLEKC